MRKKVNMREYNQSINGEGLYEALSSIETLRLGFKAVKRNGGSAGIDKQTISEFESNLETNLATLKKELESWTYEPQPVRRVEILKPTGGIRLLGVPCIRDRVVQGAIKALIEPILDPGFSESSYGFRPNKNQQQAVEAAKKIVESGKEYVVDIDLTKFFDRINHDKLISRLSKIIGDKRILRLIGKILRSGVMKDGLLTPTEEGTTQGSPLSPLLSNVVLDELDKELERRGLSFCRFADDANVFVRTQKAADRVMQSISKFIESRLKLEVNKEKSKVSVSKGVKFLGMTIIMATIMISNASMKRAMAKVQELTPRGTHLTLEQTIKRINMWYMGWSGYYGMTEYPSQLAAIEAHIRRRLRSRLVADQKNRRNLFNKLRKRGVSKALAAKTAYSNKGRWALSHTQGVEKAYSNKWFIEEMGLKIRSNENREHWSDIRKWIKVT